MTPTAHSDSTTNRSKCTIITGAACPIVVIHKTRCNRSSANQESFIIQGRILLLCVGYWQLMGNVSRKLDVVIVYNFVTKFQENGACASAYLTHIHMMTWKSDFVGNISTMKMAAAAANHPCQHWNFQNDSVDLSSACWITVIVFEPCVSPFSYENFFARLIDWKKATAASATNNNHQKKTLVEIKV